MDTRVRLSSGAAGDDEPGISGITDSRSLERRLKAFSRDPNVADLDGLITGWADFAKRTAPARRRSLYSRLALRVRRGQLPAWALVPALLGDHDRDLVASAATTVALSHRPDAAGPDSGPFCVLDHLLTPRTRNAGAGLGALLGLGDPRVADVIYDLRKMLVHPDLAGVLDEMLSSGSSVLHRATVEFYLRWLQELADGLPESGDTFRRVAGGLAIQRTSCTADFVIDGQPRYPAPLEGQLHEDGWRMIPLAEYTASIAPRLAALQRAAAVLPMTPEITALWGLANDPVAADR